MDKQYWKIRVGIEENWIPDGYNLTNEQVKEIIRSSLPSAYGHDVFAKVTSRRPANVIRRLQRREQ